MMKRSIDGLRRSLMADNSAIEYLLSLSDEAERIINKDGFAERNVIKNYSVEDKKEEEKVASTPQRKIMRFSLRDSYLNCHSCPLWMNRNSITRMQAGVMKPLVLFVFPYMLSNGDFLSNIEMDFFKKWLDSIKLATSEACITSLIKCPGHIDEVPQGCLELLDEQIEATKPKCIVFFSPTAKMAKLATDGKKEFIYKGIKAISTYSPSEVLADSSLKRAIWNDLQHISTLVGIEARRMEQ